MPPSGHASADFQPQSMVEVPKKSTVLATSAEPRGPPGNVTPIIIIFQPFTVTVLESSAGPCVAPQLSQETFKRWLYIPTSYSGRTRPSVWLV